MLATNARVSCSAVTSPFNSLIHRYLINKLKKIKLIRDDELNKNKIIKVNGY